MNKQEILDRIDEEIKELQSQYDYIKNGHDYVEQGILLGKINGFLHAKSYVLNLEV